RAAYDGHRADRVTRRIGIGDVRNRRVCDQPPTTWCVAEVVRVAISGTTLGGRENLPLELRECADDVEHWASLGRDIYRQIRVRQNRALSVLSETQEQERPASP